MNMVTPSSSVNLAETSSPEPLNSIGLGSGVGWGIGVRVGDGDGDGISDGDEEKGYRIYINGVPTVVTSDPTKKDTDEDGIDDFEEKYAGSDGMVSNPRSKDTDSDGIDL